MMTQDITAGEWPFETGDTFSKIIKREMLPILTEFAQTKRAEEREIFVRRSLRYFEPWPDWVLKIIVEILRVYFPTIPKSTINDAVRFVHCLVFTADLERLTGCSSEHEPNCPVERNLIKAPELGVGHLGAVYGHLMALAEKHSLLLKAAYDKKEISLKDFEAYGGNLSLEALQIEFQPQISSFLSAFPAKLLEIIEGIANAKQNTFDDNGMLQETTLTKVYGQIVRNWVKIEELSGPTALCAFLFPGLKNTATDSLYDNRVDRVKKICRRMRVKFKPLKVGGQTQPPGLSLPEKV